MPGVTSTNNVLGNIPEERSLPTIGDAKIKNRPSPYLLALPARVGHGRAPARVAAPRNKFSNQSTSHNNILSHQDESSRST